MVNNFPVQSEGNQPRGLILLNGTSIPFDSFRIINNNIYEADEFAATLPVTIQPQGFDDNFWGQVSALLAEIYLGYPSNPLNGQYTPADLNQKFVGQVDEVVYDPLTETITLAGRDLTAKFIDSITTEKFQNLTFSQIATLLAKRHGLNPVITPTTTKAGVFYQNNRTQLLRQQPEWNLLVFLAQQEDFLLYVDGLNLVAKPQPSPSANPFVIPWQPPNEQVGYPQSTIINPRFSRALTIANDVIVKVRSYTFNSPASYTKTVQATHNEKTFISGKAQPVGKAQVYSYDIPGLTPEQALQRAQQILRQITRQEINFDFEMPGINTLKKDRIIKTQGFAEGFNQIYYPDSITHEFSVTDGYNMSVHAKNHSPISIILV